MTFYHLVTGETPFSGSTGAVIMMKHLTEQLPNPQDVNDQVPDGVVHIIQKMMAKAPDDRYADCKALLEDLELVIDGKMPSSQAIDVGGPQVSIRAEQKRPGISMIHAGISPCHLADTFRRFGGRPFPQRRPEGGAGERHGDAAMKVDKSRVRRSLGEGASLLHALLPP